MIFAVSLSLMYSLLAGLTNLSGTSPSSTTLDLALAITADKAVKAILPFLKELSDDEWWTRLLAAWIDFEVKGPSKSVSSFHINLASSQLMYNSGFLITIVLEKLLYG
jgi:hypothetical protein